MELRNSQKISVKSSLEEAIYQADDPPTCGVLAHLFKTIKKLMVTI